MRWTRFVIGTVAASGMFLAGCSTGDDGGDTTPQTSASESSEPPDEPSDDSSDEPSDDSSGDSSGDGAEASDELIAWADEFCGSMAPVTEEFTALEDLQTSDPEALARVIEAFQNLGPLFTAALETTESLGPPPVENGEELHAAMTTAFQTLSDTFAEVQPELDALDPNDPQSLEAITPLFADLLPQLEQGFAGLDETADSPEMDAAFDEAAACQDLELGGS